MKLYKKVLSVFTLLIVLVTLFLYLNFKPTAYVKDYEKNLGFDDLVKETKFNEPTLKVTYLGVSTLLFDDGETSFMTDGFFSRPSLLEAGFTKLSPNEKMVNYALSRIDTARLRAVIPIHSHYDHALDSSMVVSKTGAKLIGSESTANIGRSFGLKEKQIQTVQYNDEIKLGKFTIKVLESRHSPSALYSGTIDKLITLPAKAKDFKLGECYSLVIRHQDKKVIVHGSAGFVPGMYKNIKADVTFLGTGVLGVQSKEFRLNYWNEVIKATSSKKAILIHWDDFWKPLNSVPIPQPWPIDDFKVTMDFLLKKGEQDKVEIRIPRLWQKFKIFTKAK